MNGYIIFSWSYHTQSNNQAILLILSGLIFFKHLNLLTFFDHPAIPPGTTPNKLHQDSSYLPYNSKVQRKAVTSFIFSVTGIIIFPY